MTPSSSSSSLTDATLPAVDVIIPCHNRAETVDLAVRSVLDQDYPNLRVFAVDDRSTDATVDVLQRIDDPRLSVVHNSGPRGASGARNHGAWLGNAPWIAFQDSDDQWLPGKLLAQMSLVTNSDAVAVYCGMVLKADLDPDTPVSKRFPPRDTPALSGDILPSLVKDSFISTQMLAVRRDVFTQVGGFDESFRALVDWELMLRVAQHGPTAFVDDDLVVQRFTPNSITKNSTTRLASQEKLVEKHHDLLSRYDGALAHHYHRIAGAHRNFGHFAAAAAAARQSMRHGPTVPKYIANAVWLSLKARFARETSSSNATTGGTKS